MLGQLVVASLFVWLAVWNVLCEGFSTPCRVTPKSGATTTTLLRAETGTSSSSSNGSAFEEYEEDFDAYARDLDPREARSQVEKENKEYAIVDRTALWMRAVRFPFRVIKKILPAKKTKPGKLILLRCGESTWNANQTFSGWADPDLTDKGIRECKHGAQ